MQQALKQTLYEQLEHLPEGLTGEILNGQLHTQRHCHIWTRPGLASYLGSAERLAWV